MGDPVVVIGAGPAGLAAAGALAMRRIPSVLLEAQASPGWSWTQQYDRLHLHTTRRLSRLPGLSIPHKYGRWVARDDLVAYLRRYADHHRLDVRTGQRVTLVERRDERWAVSTEGGVYESDRVIVATGYNRKPYIPGWPGAGEYDRPLIHSSAYRNPQPFAGKRVLVVGSGNSGCEIAADLAEAGVEVGLSVRTPPHIFPRSTMGVPTQLVGIVFRHAPPRLADPIMGGTRRMTVGDLTRYGLPDPSRGPYRTFLDSDVVPTLDVGLIEQLRLGRAEILPAVDRLDGSHVVLADGNRLDVDAVIAATGYRRGLEPLVGWLGVLGDDGRPLAHGPDTHPSAPGLHFIGFTNPISGNLRELGIDARRIARVIDER